MSLKRSCANLSKSVICLTVIRALIIHACVSSKLKVCQQKVSGKEVLQADLHLEKTLLQDLLPAKEDWYVSQLGMVPILHP